MARAQQAPVVPEIQLTQPTPEVTLPTPAKTETITREIHRVIVEIPLCTNPPDTYKTTHLNFHLMPSRSKTARQTVHQLWSALTETGATLANGYKIRDKNHAILWLLEQIGEQAK